MTSAEEYNPIQTLKSEYRVRKVSTTEEATRLGKALAVCILGGGKAPEGKGEKINFTRADLTTTPNREAFVDGMNNYFLSVKSKLVAIELLDTLSQPGKPIQKIVVTNTIQQVEI